MPKARVSRFLPVVAVLLLLAAFAVNYLFTYSLKELAQRAEKRLEARVDRSQQALAVLDTAVVPANAPQLYAFFDNERIGVYQWRGDSLRFWNNAQIPLSDGPRWFKPGQGIVDLRQGVYLYVCQTTGNGVTSVAVSRIRSAYDLQNNYLKNAFADWTGIPPAAGVSFSRKDGTPVLLGGSTLFYINGSDDYLEPWAANLATALFVVAYLLVLICVLLAIKGGVGAPLFAAGVVFILGVRLALIALHWPSFFYRSLLYDVQVFGDAGSWTDFFLGDMLLNACTGVFMAVAAHMHFRDLRPYNRLFVQFLLFAASALVVWQINRCLNSLVYNSTLDFDFLNVFNIRSTTLLGVAVLAAWAMALYVLVCKWLALTSAALLRRLGGWAVYCTGVVVVQAWLDTSGFALYWFILFSGVAGVLVYKGYAAQSVGIGCQILVMSFITSVLFIGCIEQKQQMDLGVLSSNLSELRDPILENEFSGLPGRIAGDENLGNLLRILPDTRREIEQLLKQRYFGEYFNRYHLEFSLFDSLCTPLLRPQQAILLNEGFFEDQIRWKADSTADPDLFFLSNFRNNARYIGRIAIGSNRLYVFMEPKQFEEQGSFPDLLLDRSQQKQEFRNFSYAVYRGGRNTGRFGDFNYPFFLPDSGSLARANPDFMHHFIKESEATQIISQHRRSRTDYFTYNSYLFLFFSLTSYAAYLVYAAVFTSRFSTPSITRRIQTIIIVLLLLVMLAVGVTSGRLVSGQFEADNRQQLREKTGLLINELASAYSPEEIVDANQREVIGSRLSEFAHLFDAVITLFDKNGRLFTTSQPRLYELGLAAPLANPQAFYALKSNSAASECVTETAGELKYLSLYTPLYTPKKELLGFVNLPYFARQKDLVDELSGIISALINVYIILFVISIVAGLLLSGYITQPLQLIQQQIANISLGRRNEKINWESHDEIGRLVFEYNQMLVKLEESAALLARSEREGAWREMAKQVAHEIKNPLTPMKLNLQYLQHLMKTNPADFREKFEKASAGIIEQIDSLAAIANEFSNFARLPVAQLQPVHLSEVVAAAASIVAPYKHIRFDNQITGNLLVMGDREQCLRVFNNLLKNAIQAVEGSQEGSIRVWADVQELTVRVMVQDNGHGIPDALKPKIFSPNFTTKTTGSGLGLAMVHNIMQGVGGRAGFQSEQGQGATFWLEFQKAVAASAH